MRSQNVMTGSMAILQYFLIMPAGRQGAGQGIHHFTGGSFPFISLILILFLPARFYRGFSSFRSIPVYS